MIIIRIYGRVDVCYSFIDLFYLEFVIQGVNNDYYVRLQTHTTPNDCRVVKIFIGRVFPSFFFI